MPPDPGPGHSTPSHPRLPTLAACPCSLPSLLLVPSCAGGTRRGRPAGCRAAWRWTADHGTHRSRSMPACRPSCPEQPGRVTAMRLVLPATGRRAELPTRPGRPSLASPDCGAPRFVLLGSQVESVGWCKPQPQLPRRSSPPASWRLVLPHTSVPSPNRPRCPQSLPHLSLPAPLPPSAAHSCSAS